MESLVIKLRNKTASRDEVDQIINAHKGLAVSIASRFFHIAHHLREVFVADALFMLVKAVNDAADRLTDNNIAPYISRKISGFLMRTLTEQRAVRTPYSTIKQTGQATICSISMGHVHKACTSGQSLMELKELISKSIKSDIEKQIIDLRIQGYKDPEIANKLKCTAANVSLIRKRIEKRFEALQ